MLKCTDAAVAAAWNDTSGLRTVADVAQAVGIRERSLYGRIASLRLKPGGPDLVDRQFVKQTHAAARDGRPPAPPRPAVRRYLLTAAQDDTAVHLPFWRNLVAYGQHLDAEILVAGFTYNKAVFSDHETRSAVFAEILRPFLRHDNTMLGDLMFAAKMNILPTAVKPLSGLETYSRGAWAVFPHAKTQLISVPALPGQHPAMVMTTGACTVPNYIEKKAGLKAEFHHTIGAVIVEIDEAGRLFCRHLSAATDGSFQDLDTVVRDETVTSGHRVEQITWGDIHREKIDPVVARAAWGFDVESETIVTTDTMFHTLRPRHQAFHDLLDFEARNHHRRGDHHFGALMIAKGTDVVEDAVRASARFLRATAADWCTSVVVASNHHDALTRWLREADPRQDPRNTRYWCELNLEMYRAIETDAENFDLFARALSKFDDNGLADIVFVPRNGSYQVCQAHGGIETGMHGDEGPNGARGSVTNLNRVATRANIGHSHSANWLDGVVQSGLCGLMDQKYNSGPSSWSHSQIVTHPNGKRQIVTMLDGKWRA